MHHKQPQHKNSNLQQTDLKIIEAYKKLKLHPVKYNSTNQRKKEIYSKNMFIIPKNTRPTNKKKRLNKITADLHNKLNELEQEK